MIELLVCLGVLAIAMGSILSIFVVGTRFAATAQRRMDAGRVARAVFEVANQRVTDTTWGRNQDGNIQGDGTSITNLTGTIVPPNLIVSPVSLVWECTLDTYAAGDLNGLHILSLIVSHDSDGSGTFNLPGDEIIGTYYAVLADR